MPTINIKQENVTYIAMWLLLFSTPMLILIIHASSNSNLDIDWWTIMHIEEILAMYFVAFLVHNFLLAPMLLTIQAADMALCMFDIDIGGCIYRIAKLDKTNNAWTKTAQTKS